MPNKTRETNKKTVHKNVSCGRMMRDSGVYESKSQIIRENPGTEDRAAKREALTLKLFAKTHESYNKSSR